MAGPVSDWKVMLSLARKGDDGRRAQISVEALLGRRQKTGGDAL
jgi:hypothetical protein